MWILGIREFGNWELGNDQLPAEPEHVWNLLLQLYVHKSLGPDGTHPRVLKDVASVITEPPFIICQWSWESGEVPNDWKMANIVPVFKKGKKEDSINYRPASLTSVPDKI